MAVKFFIVPIHDLEAAEAEVNAFLNSHTVLGVERHFVDRGGESFWSLCADYVESGGRGSQQGRQRSRVDYRERLSEEDFVLYAKLRDLRKEIAQAEGVPLYNVFNNNQLATMVEKKARTKADLESIAGVGDARVDKYGKQFLDFLAKQRGRADETDKPSV
jgi:superfamily II DNA helicase RecQ